MASSSAISADKTLKQLFQELWGNYLFLNTTTESSNSPKFQEVARSVIDNCEIAIVKVNILQLFSTNEDIDEIPTSELKYMYLSAILAQCTNQLTVEDRASVVEKTETFYKDYLRLCRNYSIPGADIMDLNDDDDDRECEEEKPSIPKSSTKMSLEDQQRQRQAKIERLKKKQETSRRLKEMEEHVKEEHVDEETQRAYYMTQIESFILQTVEELEFLKQEKEMLAFMASRTPKDLQRAENKEEKKRTTVRPFIITKTQLQKRVFGLGYPSIPTYTLDEFYEDQVKAGKLPAPGETFTIPQAQSTDPSDQEEAEKERKVENDDEEMLRSAREWDEWKDDHKRGWGNMHNKG